MVCQLSSRILLSGIFLPLCDPCMSDEGKSPFKPATSRSFPAPSISSLRFWPLTIRVTVAGLGEQAPFHELGILSHSISSYIRHRYRHRGRTHRHTLRDGIFLLNPQVPLLADEYKVRRYATDTATHPYALPGWIHGSRTFSKQQMNAAALAGM